MQGENILKIINSMEISLRLYSDSFKADAHIICPCNIKKKFTFCLNNDLKIISVKADSHISFRKTGEVNLKFRSPSQIIEITAESPVKELYISYSGMVQFDEEKKKNYNNVITQDIVSLSWYSVWFPQKFPFITLKNKVVLENGAPWFVLKAKYYPKNDVWDYSNPLNDPYNIIAYRKNKLNIISNEYMNIYTVEGDKKEIFQSFSKIYNDIIKYYNGNLFKKRHLSFTDVALIAPAINIPETAYVRRGLLWCSTFGETENEIIRLWAHETAHKWCSGARTGSWEDWLNETTAEWSALLFALKSNNYELFDSILLPKIKRYYDLPAIRTKDGSRPEGVHDKGTVLFYKVYSETDFETMEKVIRCFADLKIKNTNFFIKKLRYKGLSKAADIIEQGLTEDVSIEYRAMNKF